MTENKKRHCNVLDSLNCFVPSTIPRRFYSGDYWFSRYGLYGQPCHKGFRVKITDSPSMGTVNHATEDLQHRILDFSKYCLHENGKRGKTQMLKGKVQHTFYTCAYYCFPITAHVTICDDLL